MRRCYEAGGKSHAVLRQLADGHTATHIHLAAELGFRDQPGPRRKLSYMLSALTEDGLLALISADYAITTAGLQALDRLDAGECIEIARVA